MEKNSNLYLHFGAQAANLAVYFMLAGKVQGVCSAGSIAIATALQYISSNAIGNRKKPEVARNISTFFLGIIGLGCLMSRTGLKVSALSMAYFRVSYDLIHTYRPKGGYQEEIRKGEADKFFTAKPVKRPINKPKSSPNKPRALMQRQLNDRKILNFFNGIKEECSFTIDQVLEFNDEEIETNSAAFISWLFPTAGILFEENLTASKRNPVLTVDLAEKFSRDEAVMGKYRVGLTLMLQHFGLDLTSEGVVIKHREKYEGHKAYIIGRNFLVITRIFNSLMQLGESSIAESLFNQLKGISREEGMDHIQKILDDTWEGIINPGSLFD